MPNLRCYAEAHGYAVYKEQVEEELGSTVNRTEFKQLFADAHQQRLDLVLFWSLDRISREGVNETLLKYL